MKTFALMGVSLASLLAGCSSAAVLAAGSSGGTSGGTSGTTGEGYQPLLGTPCTPNAVVDVCAASGLVCDLIEAVCRKPVMGELCSLEVGCGTQPPNPPELSCVTTDINGTGVSICVVRCSGTDSASCPYGTSCYANYCRPGASTSCVPGEVCALGEGVVGQCLADGMSFTCLSVGDQYTPYAGCNPYALNSQMGELCGAGLVCRATAFSLGGFADAGFCVPLCGQGCQSDQHCLQPSNAFYEICNPGIPCSIDLDTCPAPETVCIPDDPNGLSGGCIPVASDAGSAWEVCRVPDTFPETSPCQEGACLPADGGSVCTPLCNRVPGGRPYCLTETCEPIDAASSASDVVGACR